jgi:hypothetical protein
VVLGTIGLLTPVLISACTTAEGDSVTHGSWQASQTPTTFGSSDDFNDLPLGGLPERWSAERSGGTVGVAEVPDAIDRSLRVAKDRESGVAAAAGRFAALTGVVRVEARIRVEQDTGESEILRIADPDRKVAARIVIRDGQLVDASGKKLLPILPARWYSLRVMLRTDARRFDLFVDGQKALTNVAFQERPKNITTVAARIGDGQIGTLYLDNVAVQRVPDPSVPYVVLDQFNELAVGSHPLGYKVSGKVGTVGIVPNPSDEDRSLAITKKDAAGDASAIRQFQPQSGLVTVQVNLRADETTGTKVGVYAQSANGKISCALQFRNGWLIYYTGDAAHQLTPAVAGEWYTIRLVLDFSARQFEIFVDGRRFAPDNGGRRVPDRWAFRDHDARDLASLMFSLGNQQTGTVRVDNVIVFTNPTTTPPGTAVDVRRAPYGAAGDGRTDDTAAVQRAIDAVPAGGSVVLSNGTFLTGMIRLKSNMTLWISRDAVLLGTQLDSGYPVFDSASMGTPAFGGSRSCLILSVGASNVSIAGGGTIDGNGEKPEWAVDAAEDNPVVRPTLMFLTKGMNISVRDVHVKNAAAWAIVPAEVKGVVIADVTIDSNLFANRDGIDVVDCEAVLIERVSVWADDDAICFKSFEKAVDGVVVRMATVGRSQRANGVKFGTESFGAFRNVVVEDVLVKHVDKAAIMVTAVDGAVVNNLTFRRVTIDDALRTFFVLLGKRSQAKSSPRWISGLRFEGITTSGQVREPSAVSGQSLGDKTYRVYDVLVSGLRQTVAGGERAVPGDPAEYAGGYPESTFLARNPKSPAYGIYLRHSDGVTIRGATTVTAKPDVRQPVAFSDVLNLTR